MQYSHPAHARHGSELQEPTAPITQTSVGYQSVYLATLCDGAAILRLSAAGYRVLLRSKRDPSRYYVEEHGLNPSVGISRLDTVYNFLSQVGDYLDASDEQLEASKSELEVFPDSAHAAWSWVNRGQYNAAPPPEWLPESLETARKNGQTRGF